MKISPEENQGNEVIKGEVIDLELTEELYYRVAITGPSRKPVYKEFRIKYAKNYRYLKFSATGQVLGSDDLNLNKWTKLEIEEDKYYESPNPRIRN